MNKTILFLIFFSTAFRSYCQTADFTISTGNGLFCSPAAVTFTQTCTGNPTSFIWDFGNNTFGDQPVELSTYTTAGTYTVKLIAIFQNTTLSVSKTVVINPAGTAAIAVDKNYICQPGTINFTGSGGGNITNYEWNFADGTPVTDIATPAISHTFTAYAIDSVTLKTTNDQGCTATASAGISIKQLPISGTASPVNGCIPATVNFSGSATLPVGSSVTSYTWDYGDGSPPFVSPGNTTSHNYLSVGNYSPTLTIATAEGCTNTFNFNQLAFGTPPTGLVASAKKDTICGSDSAVFVVAATNANLYAWNFGDGTLVSSSDTIMKHRYTTIGNKTIRVRAFYNLCAAPVVTSFQITVVGVVANYSLSNTCSNKDTYLFSDSSSGTPTSSLWTFGDGAFQANTLTAVHTFAATGQFATKLSVYDAVTGCADSLTKVVYTAAPSLTATNSSLCRFDTTYFSIVNNYTNPTALYTWNLLGNQTAPAGGVITHMAVGDVLGSFNNFVIIDNGPGTCLDTITMATPVVVKGPVVDFTAQDTICLGTVTTITNNSHPFIPGESIQLSYWNFGSGPANDTVFQPAPFQYGGPGNYLVKLTAVDINGCKDSLIKFILVNPVPFLHILSASDTLCLGLSDSLVAIHSNNLVWSPAAGLSCTNCDTTLASPTVSTQYFATATNSANCSIRDSITITVSSPFVATATLTDAAICQLQSTTVDVEPKGKVIVWSPATGLSDATSYNPTISPAQTTTYTAALSDSTGCTTNTSTATVTLIVKSLPVVDAGPDQTYPKGTSYSFAPAYSSNAATYLWTPSDLLTCSNCAIPNGVADRTQLYVVQVTSDSGCVASDSVTIGIECKYANLFVPKAFTPNNDNLNDVFYPRAVGIKTITKFIIYDRRGQVMFEADNFSPNDRNFGWNGRFKGADQSAGAYVYILEAVCDIGEKLFKKDSFILVR